MSDFKLCLHNALPDDVEAILLPTFQISDWEDIKSSLDAAGLNLPYFQKNDFTGKKDEVLIVYPPEKNTKYIWIGLGERKSPSHIKTALLSFRKKYHQKLGKVTAISLLFIENEAPESISEVALGWELGNYEIGLYQTSKEEKTESNVVFSTHNDQSDQIEKDLRFGTALGETQKSLLDLVNAPSNHKSPIELAKWAQASSTRHQYHCEILEKPQLKSLGMHALLAVNRGSEIPAKCLVMEYTPPSFSRTVALIGKGVTFDTGGLSIKSSRNMHYMKSDMGGAAATMGAVEMVAKMQLPIRVIGVIPATDNSVDAKSIKPGDVIQSYAGKSIEIIDTDAEGRLILADGIAYAIQQFEPDHVIDSATLTGSVIQALGLQAAGLYSNNDDLAHVIQTAGEETGEKVWRLPVWDAYMESMKSDIADIRNLSDKPFAGSITAAKFLQFFTNEHPSWAHLDIAGMAFGPNGLSKGYSATAFGIHLLYETIHKLSK